LAIWTSRRREAILQQHLLTAALALTAFWALCTAVGGNADILPGMAEGLRNFAWLSFMFVILHRGERRTNEYPAAVTAIYTVLGIVLMLQWLVDIIAAERAVLDRDRKSTRLNSSH